MIQFDEHICQMGGEKNHQLALAFVNSEQKTCYFLSLTPHEQLVVFFFPPRGSWLALQAAAFLELAALMGRQILDLVRVRELHHSVGEE